MSGTSALSFAGSCVEVGSDVIGGSSEEVVLVAVSAPWGSGVDGVAGAPSPDTRPGASAASVDDGESTCELPVEKRG